MNIDFSHLDKFLETVEDVKPCANYSVTHTVINTPKEVKFLGYEGKEGDELAVFSGVFL